MATVINNLEELLRKQEPLNPELRPYLQKTELGVWLKHPLIFSAFHHDAMNALVNAAFEQKKKQLEAALAERRWPSYVFIHERPHRFDALAIVSALMRDVDYWSVLGSVWVDSENLWQYGDCLSRLFNCGRPGKVRALMTEEEQAFFRKLPKELTIFRGHQGVNRRGMAWSLNYSKAVWFANRFAEPGRRGGVIRATVSKSDVHAVFLRRGEFEIVADFAKLREVVGVGSFDKAPRPKWMHAVAERAKGRFRLGTRSDHGPNHWRGVELAGISLSAGTTADRDVVRLFALLHDCERQHEMHDPEHGHRAAEFAKTLYEEGLIPISEERFDVLEHALRFHNDGQTSDDLTVGTCWDADRHELPRVGIVPDKALLSTVNGRIKLWAT